MLDSPKTATHSTAVGGPSAKSIAGKRQFWHWCVICEGAFTEIDSLFCSGVCGKFAHQRCLDRMMIPYGEDFTCLVCSSGDRLCMICGGGGEGITQCLLGSCRSFFHLKCAEKEFEAKSLIRQSGSKDKKNRTPSNLCPRHTCVTCGESNHVIPCIRCHKSFHVNCAPFGSTEISGGLLCSEHPTPKLTTALRTFKSSNLNKSAEILGLNFMINCAFDVFSLPLEFMEETKQLKSLEKQKDSFVEILDLADEIENCPVDNKMKKRQKLESVEKIKKSDNSLIKSDKSVQNPFKDFKTVTKNIYVSMPALKLSRVDDDSVCSCKIGSTCSEDECVNRMLHIECNPRSCPRGSDCKNQRLQKREHAPLQIINTDGKGYGAISKSDLNPGDLITEYCGEIIDEKTRDERLLDMEKAGDTKYYFFSIDSQTIIDAGRKGSLARFLNHSCNPNCIAQKWDVNGVTRVGIFAKQKINAGEELTYDYNFLGFWKDGKEHRCNCGASNCSGFFGKRPLKILITPTNKPNSSSSGKLKKPKQISDLALPQKMTGIKNFSAWMDHLLLSSHDPYSDIAASHNIYLVRNRQLVYEKYRSILSQFDYQTPSQ
jgi:hypothetical protein